MSAENPRSPLGRDLWASYWQRRVRIWPGGLSVAFFLSVSLSAPSFSQAEETPSGGALERADVETFYYSEPDADLLLDEAGIRKREALLSFYRGISLEGSDMAAALVHFKKVLELDPSNVGLAMESATHSAVFGRFSEALAILEESLDKNQGKRDAYLNLSRYCDAHHNNDEELKARSLEYAEMAFEKFPSDHVVIEHFVALLVAREKTPRATEVLEESLQQEVADGSYWLAMGSIARQVWPLRNEENRQRVFGVFEKALQADPQNLPVVEKVAQFYKMAGNAARATQIYELLVQRSPDRLRAREDLAELYWSAGKKQEAAAGLESLVQINPLDFQVRRKLTAYYAEMGELGKALEHSQTIVDSGAGLADDFLLLYKLQIADDKLGGALQTLREGVAVHPDEPRLGYALGGVYLRVDRFKDAYATFKLVEGQADTEFLSEGFYFDYAVSAERAGELESAEALFRKSIELVPDDAKEDKAKSLNYLGYMWLEKEMNIDEAGEMIQQANELKPDNGAYLDSLGWYFYLKEDFDQAIKHLLRAAELMEDEPDSVIFEHLARAYLSKGELGEARQYSERALELEPDKAALKELLGTIEKAAAQPVDQ